MNSTVLAACLGWMFSAADIVLLIVFQRSVAAGLGVDVQLVHYALSVGLLGSALGGVLFAQLGDRHGRVRALGWCILLYSLATAGMALAPNIYVLMAMRFLSGAGTGGEWSLGFALVAEVSPQKGRGRRGGLVAGMFNVGTFIAVALFQSKLDWRIAFGVMSLPALLVFWLRQRVPESPIWLALTAARARGEVNEKLEAAYKRPPISELWKGRYAAITLKTTLLFIIMNFAFYTFSTIIVNYLQESPSTGALGLDTKAQGPYQAVINGASMVSVIVAGLVSDRIGRRLSFFLVCLIGACGYFALYSITHDATGVPKGLLIALSIITTGYGINGLIGTLSSELYPTHLRSTGPGFGQNIGKGIGGAAAPALAGALVPLWGYPVVLALPGILLLVMAALIWTFPAVGGRELKAVEDDSYLDKADQAA